MPTMCVICDGTKEDEDVSYFIEEFSDEPVCVDCIDKKGLQEE